MRKFTKQMSDQWGFSLFEAALTIAVLGAMVTAFLPSFVNELKVDKIRGAREDVRMARDELLGHLMINKELPADFRLLGHVQDSYDNDLQYANASVENICTFITSGNNTSLKIETLDGTVINDVVYVIASMGENDVLDTDMNATTIKIYKYGDESAYSNNTYDDVVEYVTLGYIASKVDCP
ncbi:MAG: pilus assembly FimT family protein [Desulfovibrio sp.]